jgi:hypothetical protein
MVPSLISGNKFIEGAFSAQDLQAFLQKPMSVLQLAADLGLPEQLLQVAMMEGFDPDTIVTAADLFKALGVDPQRVSAELKLLKDNVLVEGVAGYLARAKSKNPDQSRLTSPNDRQLRAEVPGVAVAVPSRVPGGAATKMSEAPGIPDIAPVATNQAVRGQIADPNRMASNGLSSKVNDGLEFIQEQSEILSQLTLDDIEELAEKIGMPVEALMGAVQHIAHFDGSNTDQATSDLRRAVDLRSFMNLNETPLQSQGAISDRSRLSYDPFEAMGAYLVKSAQAESLPTRTTAEELLGSAFDPFAVDTKNPTVILSTQQLNSDEEFAADAPMLSAQPLTISALANGGAVTRSMKLESELTNDLMLNVNREALPLVIEGKLQDDRGAGRDDRRESNDESVFNIMSDQFSSDLKGGMTTKSFDISAPQSTASLTPAQRQEMVQRIADQANYLTTQGGGTARIEIQSPELGAITMAIRLDQDRVDLRVMTTSERAREALLADLSGLSGALSAQSVQLGKVDVGVGGFDQQRQQNSNQQFFAFDQQQQQGSRGQREAQDFSSQLSTLPKKALANVNQPIGKISQPLPTISGPGRITVRI